LFKQYTDYLVKAWRLIKSIADEFCTTDACASDAVVMIEAQLLDEVYALAKPHKANSEKIMDARNLNHGPFFISLSAN